MKEKKVKKTINFTPGSDGKWHVEGEEVNNETNQEKAQNESNFEEVHYEPNDDTTMGKGPFHAYGYEVRDENTEQREDDKKIREEFYKKNHLKLSTLRMVNIFTPIIPREELRAYPAVDQEGLLGIMASIEEIGTVDPIILRTYGTNVAVVCGEARIRALRQLYEETNYEGFLTCEARFILNPFISEEEERDMLDKVKIDTNWNRRKNLTPRELAAIAYNRLVKARKIKTRGKNRNIGSMVAESINMSRSSAYSYDKAFNLCDELMELFNERKLKMRAMPIWANLSKEDQIMLFNVVGEENINEIKKLKELTSGIAWMKNEALCKKCWDKVQRKYKKLHEVKIEVDDVFVKALLKTLMKFKKKEVRNVWTNYEKNELSIHVSKSIQNLLDSEKFSKYFYYLRSGTAEKIITLPDEFVNMEF